MAERDLFRSRLDQIVEVNHPPKSGADGGIGHSWKAASARSVRMIPAICLMAVRGLDLFSALIFMAEIGDLLRFATPRQLMTYLGLVSGKESTGDRVWRGGITKAGNHRARRIPVECSWSYRHPPRVGKKKLAKVEATPPAVQEIAWKAQARLLTRRCR